MSAPAKDRGYAYPLERGNQQLGETSGEDVMATRREQLLRKLLAWGDRDVAIILGLLPDDGSVA